ncbi:YecA/YgfB family protein [Pseudofulvibacter geojedonensis]|uniref:YecA family protein n=1 Tax=Pseudofulvibacter geojedonensis TaxID=1123758 RepID=A0ABW3I1L9_9FLAO
MRDENEIIAELNEFSSHSDFLTILLYLVGENLNCSTDQLATRNFRALLNENEITFLFGLWLKNRHKKVYSKDSFKVRAGKIHKLMDDYHLTFLKHFPKPGETENFHLEFRTNPASVRETVFYGPSGAYDYQFVNFLETKYSRDKNWLIANKNYNLGDAKNLYISLKSIINFKLNVKDFGDDFISLYSFNFNNYIFKKNPNFTKILDSLSFGENEILNQDFNGIGDLNQFKIKPVIKTDTSYIIPLPYSLAEAIYDSPFYWMIDDKKYRNKAQKNRGDIAEQIVAELLSKKIDSNLIHSEVEVKEVKATTVTDIDVCVVKDGKMLIFQVKSKRLSQLSKNGDIETFEKDFKLAVKDAYDQATLPYELILSNKCYFQYKESGERIELPKINEIYCACVVLDSYASITAHTRLFFQEEKVTPITMSIFDLEIIMEYSDNFDSLFDYFKKRTQNSKYFIADSELGFFGGYLRTKLQRRPNSDLVAFDADFAQRFDLDYYKPLMEKYEMNFPESIKNIGRNDYCFCGSGIKFKKCCG